MCFSSCAPPPLTGSWIYPTPLRLANLDENGVVHEWRKDLIEALAARQREDGAWVNENSRWLEGDASLVTGYALLALSYCKK